MYLTFALLVTLLCTSLYAYCWHKCNYWRRRGVLQLPAQVPLEAVGLLQSYQLTELLHAAYVRFKQRNAKIAGIYVYTQPVAVILNLELAKSILIKDFHIFRDRFEYVNDTNDLFATNLFSVCGEKWRTLRTKLTPTFTSGKMKFMFPTILTVAAELERAFEREVAYNNNNNNKINVHDLMGRYTTDVIANCVFGIECNSLNELNVPFRVMGKRILDPYNRPSVRWRLFITYYANILKHFGLKLFSREIESFFTRIVRETVEQRERYNIKRNDFMNLLIELKNVQHAAEERPHTGLTIEELAPQAFTFFLAGFETSSSNMSYALFELAKQPEKQARLRSEICAVLERHAGVLSYEAMLEMNYLDQVISETLRKYPALGALTRFAGEDYSVPGTNIVLEKGTRVLIPVREFHYDPEIFAQPEEFRPERFSAAEIRERHAQAFLGFGDGPRNCIGMRFGRMQVRVGMITLLKTFRFYLADETQKELKLSNNNTILIPYEVLLKAEKI